MLIAFLFASLHGFEESQRQIFSAARMLGAPAAFDPSRRELYLRGLQPQVLQLSGLQPLALEFGLISGPPKLGQPSRARRMRGFNPSIAPAPEGLCPRCAFVVAVRADALHQCDRYSPPLGGQASRRVAGPPGP